MIDDWVRGAGCGMAVVAIVPRGTFSVVDAAHAVKEEQDRVRGIWRPCWREKDEVLGAIGCHQRLRNAAHDHARRRAFLKQAAFALVGLLILAVYAGALFF